MAISAGHLILLGFTVRFSQYLGRRPSPSNVGAFGIGDLRYCRDLLASRVAAFSGSNSVVAKLLAHDDLLDVSPRPRAGAVDHTGSSSSSLADGLRDLALALGDRPLSIPRALSLFS